MAVNRPNFSKARPSQKRSVRTEVSATRRPKKTKSANKRRPIKGLKSVLYILLLGLLMLDGGWPPEFLKGQAQDNIPPQAREEERTFEENGSQNSSNGSGTRILGEVGLTTEEMEVVATRIFRVAKSMTNQYQVSDGLSLSMYVLRYLAEIGEYELAYRDIMKLVKAFEKYTGQDVSEEVYNILEQVKKIRFGKRDGRLFCQFFSKKPSVGIIIPLNEKSEDPDSSLKEIKRVVAVDGSTLSFNEVDTAAEKKKVRDFLKTPVKILNVLEKIVEALYQIHDDLIEGIDDYLEWGDAPAPAMIIGMEGISVEVATRTLFNDITFKFQEAYTFPGIHLGNEPTPSFALGGKAKLLNLKVSVDK
jgi:hypothetical protein